MRNYVIFFMFVFLCSITVLAQQDSKVLNELAKSERTDAIKLNLLSPFYGTVNLAWQHRLSNDASFQLTMTYTDFDSYGSTDNTNTGTSTSNSFYDWSENQLTKGVTIVPEYRFVLNGRGLSGIYIAPFARFMYYEYSRDLMTRVTTTSTTPFYSVNTVDKRTPEFYTYYSAGLGVVIGKQFIFRNRVVLDLFGGPVYTTLLASNQSVTKTSDVLIGSGIPNTYIRGYGVRAGLSVGFLF